MPKLKRIITNWLSGIRLAWQGNTVFRGMVSVSIVGIVLALVARVGTLKVTLLIGSRVYCVWIGNSQFQYRKTLRHCASWEK